MEIHFWKRKTLKFMIIESLVMVIYALNVFSLQLLNCVRLVFSFVFSLFRCRWRCSSESIMTDSLSMNTCTTICPRLNGYATKQMQQMFITWTSWFYFCMTITQKLPQQPHNNILSDELIHNMRIRSSSCRNWNWNNCCARTPKGNHTTTQLMTITTTAHTWNQKTKIKNKTFLSTSSSQQQK